MWASDGRADRLYADEGGVCRGGLGYPAACTRTRKSAFVRLIGVSFSKKTSTEFKFSTRKNQKDFRHEKNHEPPSPTVVAKNLFSKIVWHCVN